MTPRPPLSADAVFAPAGASLRADAGTVLLLMTPSTGSRHYIRSCRRQPLTQIIETQA
jgi:hypothetical protein